MASPTTGKKRNKPTSKRHRRTIAEKLFEQWRELARKGDAEELATLLNVSKPTIDKAIIYGCCHQQVLIDGITTFFASRIMREQEAADKLAGLRQEVAPVMHVDDKVHV